VLAACFHSTTTINCSGAVPRPQMSTNGPGIGVRQRWTTTGLCSSQRLVTGVSVLKSASTTMSSLTSPSMSRSRVEDRQQVDEMDVFKMMLLAVVVSTRTRF